MSLVYIIPAIRGQFFLMLFQAMINSTLPYFDVTAEALSIRLTGVYKSLSLFSDLGNMILAGGGKFRFVLFHTLPIRTELFLVSAEPFGIRPARAFPAYILSKSKR